MSSSIISKHFYSYCFAVSFSGYSFLADVNVSVLCLLWCCRALLNYLLVPGICIFSPSAHTVETFLATRSSHGFVPKNLLPFLLPDLGRKIVGGGAGCFLFPRRFCSSCLGWFSLWEIVSFECGLRQDGVLWAYWKWLLPPCAGSSGQCFVISSVGAWQHFRRQDYELAKTPKNTQKTHQAAGHGTFQVWGDITTVAIVLFSPLLTPWLTDAGPAVGVNAMRLAFFWAFLLTER